MTQTGEGSGTALDSLAYLYDRYGVRVYGYAMALLSNASDAEEAVQEAFAKLYARMKGGWKPDQPENYLFRAVRNEAYSKLRRRRLFFLRAHGNGPTDRIGWRRRPAAMAPGMGSWKRSRRRSRPCR